MALKVSSWVKDEIPICRESVNLEFESKELESLVDLVDSILNPCFEYIDKDYECYCLKSKAGNTLQNHFFNLFNFRFSFRTSNSLGEEKKIFRMKKNKNFIPNFYYGLRYLSDVSGFSLILFKKSGKLRVCYYDFEEKFSTNIEIVIPVYDPKDYIPRHIKLCSRSIWILTYMFGMVSSIDVISIKNEKEWYHVRNNGSYDYVGLPNVLSAVMLPVNYCSKRFYDCKSLCLDHDELIPFKLNEKNLVEFYKPKELEHVDIDVLGIFNTTIVLIPKADSNFLYFLVYDKRMQFKVFKKIDISYFCDDGMKISLEPEVLLQGFIPEILKLLVPISTEMTVIIDVEKAQVTQILVNYGLNKKEPMGKYYSLPKYAKWSKDEEMLNLFYKNDYGKTTLLKYVLYNWKSLKDLALYNVVSFVNMEKILAFNLPQSLFREIMARKMN